ncbi:MAG: hypothetical protein ACM30E_03970 [Nitrososphaerales archaeon]
MKVNPFVFGIIILAVFFGVLGGAKAAGVWSVSAKVTSTGERVAPTGESVDEIKGWMTLADITKAYNVPLADIIAEFELPAQTPETAQLKSLESEKFSVTNLRTWLADRQQ